MNVAIKPENLVSRGVLVGRVSLITGSTSGIGLGVARALAAAGAEIVLNGFGRPEDISAAQTQIEREFRVRTLYVGADMSKPGEIADLMAKALKEFGRL